MKNPKPVNRNIMVILDGVTTLVILSMSLHIANLESMEFNAGYMVPAVFFVLALSRVIRAFLNRDEETRLVFYKHLFHALTFLLCGIILLFCMGSYTVLNAVANCYISALIIGRVMEIYRNEKMHKRTWIYFHAGFICLLVTGAILCRDAEGVFMFLVIFCLSVAHILALSFSGVRHRHLETILKTTHAAEILFGLLLLIVAFSLVLPNVEEDIRDVPDALWYCFSIVTTIGFGDISAKTLLGRTLSVVLGIYGLVVVALLTSVIVNFYHESRRHEKQTEVKEEEKT